MLTTNSCIAKNTKVPWRMIEQEAILVDVGKGEVIHLNEVAAEIWDVIDGKKTMGDIVQHICKTFSVDEETAEKDTLQFTKELLEKKLIVC